MAERRSSILRSEELAVQLEDLLTLRNWTRKDWAEQATLGVSTINRMLDPYDPKGVSRSAFASATEILVQNPSQRNKLFRLAGLPIPIRSNRTTGSFTLQVAAVISAYHLNPENQAILEQEILAHAKTVGTLLEQAQSGQLVIPKRHRRLIP